MTVVCRGPARVISSARSPSHEIKTNCNGIVFDFDGQVSPKKKFGGGGLQVHLTHGRGSI